MAAHAGPSDPVRLFFGAPRMKFAPGGLGRRRQPGWHWGWGVQLEGEKAQLLTFKCPRAWGFVDPAAPHWRGDSPAAASGLER